MTTSTFTFTARSQENPEKMVTYTLNNGHVQLAMGNVMLEQLQNAAEKHEPDSGIKLGDWAKPAAVGALQKLMEPLPLADFNATADDERFRTTTWLRAGGLRLAPIVMNWDEVDNPQGARAFVAELNRRKEKEVVDSQQKMPELFDYWASWILAVGALATAVFMLGRLWREKSARAQQ